MNFLLLLFGFLSVPVPACATACLCWAPAESDPVASAFRTANGVYFGAISRVEHFFPESGEGVSRFLYTDSIRYTVEVIRAWKGPADLRILLTDSGRASSCSAEKLNVGELYLVYASYRRAQVPSTAFAIDACSRLIRARPGFSGIQSDLRRLNELGIQPVQ